MKFGSPLIPRSDTDPTGQDKRERAAMRSMRQRLDKIRRHYVDALKAIPVEVVEINSLGIYNQKSYQFQISPNALDMVKAELGSIVDRVLLEGERNSLWLLNQYVEPSRQQGAADNWVNISTQTEEYLRVRPDLQAVLARPEYQRRLALLRGRVFEDMAGLSSDVKVHLGRILGDAVALGLNPREVAKQLNSQATIELGRANRIARTEITNAYKNARLEEADDASRELGLRFMEVHISAFSPTTRATHAARDSKLFTTQEQRQWYSVDGNAINCKCGTITVLVDSRGEPVSAAFRRRLAQRSQKAVA